MQLKRLQSNPSTTMESLPLEIIHLIFDKIFRKNPQDFYRLRRGSKTWRYRIDAYISRLMKVWAKKCMKQIPKIYLDDIIEARYPQFLSWHGYSTNYELSKPDIARDIYNSWNAFPNVDYNNVDVVEICSTPGATGEKLINSYAVNDKYLAISLVICDEINDENEVAVRIYSLDDLARPIREYPTSCKRLDFYVRDEQVFLILLQYDNDYVSKKQSLYLGQFLVNDYLHLLSIEVSKSPLGTNYAITDNELFTYTQRGESILHHDLSSNSLEDVVSTVIEVPYYPVHDEYRKITKIEISESKLVVFTFSLDKSAKVIMTVYQYQISRHQPDNTLSFSDPEIYCQNNVTLRDNSNILSPSYLLNINFGTSDISLQHTICGLYIYELELWVAEFFQQPRVTSIIVYRYHLVIMAFDVLITFRGSLRELMDYAVKNLNPGSRCAVMDLALYNLSLPCDDRVRVVLIESKPKFLVVSEKEVATVELLP